MTRSARGLSATAELLVKHGTNFKVLFIYFLFFHFVYFLRVVRLANVLSNQSRPPICNLKKYGWLGKNSAEIFGLAELSRKLKNSHSAKIQKFRG